MPSFYKRSSVKRGHNLSKRRACDGRCAELTLAGSQKGVWAPRLRLRIYAKNIIMLPDDRVRRRSSKSGSATLRGADHLERARSGNSHGLTCIHPAVKTTPLRF